MSALLQQRMDEERAEVIAEMRFRTRADANSKEIDAALREAGAIVVQLGSVGGGVPDRLVGVAGATFLLEYKNRATHARKAKAGGDGLHTPAQEKFRLLWRGGPIATVYDKEQALKAVGLSG